MRMEGRREDLISIKRTSYKRTKGEWTQINDNKAEISEKIEANANKEFSVTFTRRYFASYAHRRFYTEAPSDTETLLHTDAFTHRHFYTQTLLHKNAFTHRNFYIQTTLRIDAVTHRGFGTQNRYLDS